MSRLLIVTGPPGAGKSTVAAAIAERLPSSVLVEGDAFFRMLRRDRIDPWLPEAHSQNEAVTDAAAAAAGRFMSGGLSTVYDGVLGPWFLPRFLGEAAVGEADYLVLLPSLERCLHRVATRVGHEFRDQAATRHMHGQFADASIGHGHLLRDPPDAVDDVVAAVLARAVSGELRVAR